MQKGPAVLPESISYHFFKKRLRRKMDELYGAEDPWGSAFLSEVFEPWIREKHAELAAALKHAPVLDAGGGEGHYIARLHNLAPAFHLVDIHADAVCRANEKLAGLPVDFFTESLDRFKPRQNDYYGAIWCFSILTFLGAAKHPHTAEAIVKKLWGSLKPGGLLLAIHPYYSETEKDYLIYLLGQTGGRQEESLRRVQNQDFLLQTLHKD